MPARELTLPRGDRSGDQHAIIAGETKPPVLSRATLRLLCLVCLAVIVYGTLGPLGGGRGPWVIAVEHWSWIPPPQPGDLNDFITNLAVYFPVGVSFRLLARRRGRAGWRDLLVGEALSLTLSYVTEVLQQAMPGRVSSRTDVLVNGIGALGGCLCAVPVQRVIRRAHAFIFLQVRVPWRRWTLLAWLAAATTAVLMTMPWELTRPAAEWGFARPLAFADGGRFAMFLATGFFATGAGRLRGRSDGFACAAAFLLAAALAGLLEASQAVLREHICSLCHALTSVLGAGSGCLAALALGRRTPRGHESPARGAQTEFAQAHERPPSPRMRQIAVVALVATTAYTAIAGLWDALAHGRWRAEPVLQWIPFHAHFAAPFPAASADILQQLAVYSFLTLSCLYITLGRGRAAALLLLAGLLGLIEATRAFAASHGADTTAPLLAGIAWLVTTRVWQSVHPVRAAQ